ncbi:potassium uptake protein [Apiospora kogelbergensis]|uniref:potassium uptake protein n=1 Tax=Apiospora kogelbergensis TaxID=1337665 RepID=UPI0031318012
MSKNAPEDKTPRTPKGGVTRHPSRPRSVAQEGIWRDRPAAKTPVRLAVSRESDISRRVDDVERARRFDREDLNKDNTQVVSPSFLEEIYQLTRKQHYHGRILLWLSFQSIGVIYGDIGTSPLYVFSSTFNAHPSWDDLVGALSIIIWSLVLIVTLKYCFIVLAADDHGHGGTFALYSILARSMNTTPQNPSSPQRRGTGLSQGTNKSTSQRLRNYLEKSSRAKYALQVVGILGVSLVIADGILTPAQSVLGAVQGVHVINPDLGKPTVTGITCCILVVFFLVQPFGTSKLGTAFAPIVMVWLLFNLGSGIYNLVVYDHTVLKAFSPHFAFAYLARNRHDGWKSLSGLLLAFTGVEAMFANLAAFSKKAIQISWLGITFPCLLFAYIGQAAYISEDKTRTAYTNPFFYNVPPGTLYFSLVIAILAAIVASQALITSTFQLLCQVMRLSYFPNVKTVHTSKLFHYHIYIPAANWLLMICTVSVTAIFDNTASLGSAYGVCAILVTLLSTFMVALVALLVWEVRVYYVLPVFLIFFAIDATYTSAVLTKIPQGAWFTLAFGAILSSILMLWRYGKEAQWAAESTKRLRPESLLNLKRSPPHLARQWGGTRIGTVPGLGIFFSKSDDPGVVSTSFAQFLTKFAARPRVVVFFHVRSLPVPHVGPDDRYIVARARSAVFGPHAYRVVLRHGYADDILRPGLDADIVHQIERILSGGDPSSLAELDALRAAYTAQTVYVVGKETMRLRQQAGIRVWLRRMALTVFLCILDNSRAKMADMDLDADRIVEVGFVTDL